VRVDPTLLHWQFPLQSVGVHVNNQATVPGDVSYPSRFKHMVGWEVEVMEITPVVVRVNS